jgi:pseudouridine synthase
MRKFTPKGPGTAPAKRNQASPPAARARTASAPEDRPARRPAVHSEDRPARRPAPGSEERPIRRGAAHSEDRPTRRPAPGSEERPIRRSAARSEDRPTRRPAPGSEERPIRRGAAHSEDRPARRPAPGSEERPIRRGAAHSEDRPTRRPSTTSLPKSKPAAPAAPKRTGPRPGGPGQDRLQKILAAAGIDSRRACEQIILDGRVQVNGKTVTELGTCADPRRDVITVDLIEIQREAPVYILMNKPKGYVTTVKDDQGRPTVMALLKGVPGRLYPVGRLDFNSEGLLLMTNDGALAQVLMGPEHEIPKVYLVKVHRNPRPELLKEFQEGFLLSGRRLKPCHIEIAEKGDNPWLKVTLTEGKNQQIRRMFAAVGHPVSKLRRVQFGPLADPFLKPGAWRYLSPQEIAAIKSL